MTNPLEPAFHRSMRVRDQVPAWATEPVRLGRIRLMAHSMEIFLRRLVEPSPGAVCVWAMLASA